VNFYTVSAFDASIQGTQWEFFLPCTCGKTRITGVPDGENVDYTLSHLIPACD